MTIVVGYITQELSQSALEDQIRAILGDAVRLFIHHTEEAGLRFLERHLSTEGEISLIIGEWPIARTYLQTAHKLYPKALILALIAEGTPFRPPAFPILPVGLAGAGLDPILLQHISQVLRTRQERESQHRLLLELHRVSLSLIGEMRLDKLIFKILRIALENSHAEEAVLLLPHPEVPSQLQVACQIHADMYEAPPLQAIPAEAAQGLFLPLIQHSIQTKENILLEDAQTDAFWSRHPDVLSLGLRMVISLPLIYQGRLIGIVYLKNTGKSVSLLPSELEFLKLFTAPAAVAIQNAQLYTHMESLVQKRTEEVVRQKEALEKQALLLQQQNEDIMASLRYAQRVQRAIFPSWNELFQFFPESFLFYQPREVVGGDFYWFAHRLSKVIVAVGDCTGHGIPGAFMTIIANTLLKQIVELEGVFKPSEILYLLNLRMRAALHHEDATYQRFQEGMEIGLIQIDIKRHKVLYAGARRPLFWMHQGRGQEILGDRLTIGSPWEGEAPEFTLHTLEVEPEDMFYLFSDGFSDQLAPEGKRYQHRRFLELLEMIADQPAAQQRLLIEAELARWAGNTRQTDDILVIGLRVGHLK
jgi:serine phosphatase RsbU (regulator of sigma subunit)